MVSIVDEYIKMHSSPLPEALDWLERETYLRTNHGRMLSGPVLGRLLITFSKMISPKRILEIGTFTGYSAICLAQGLKEEGILDAVERNDELESLIVEGFRRADLEDKINLHIGAAADIIPTLGSMYDLVYIDGNKREYCRYYDLVFDMVVNGGYILADNVLWSGKLMEDPLPQDAQTQELVRFNDMIVNDPRVECFILPLRDGLNIIRKR